MSTSWTSAVLWRVTAPLLLLPALALFLVPWVELRAEVHYSGKIQKSQTVLEQTGLEALRGERTMKRQDLDDESREIAEAELDAAPLVGAFAGCLLVGALAGLVLPSGRGRLVVLAACSVAASALLIYQASTGLPLDRKARQVMAARNEANPRAWNDDSPESKQVARYTPLFALTMTMPLLALIAVCFEAAVGPKRTRLTMSATMPTVPLPELPPSVPVEVQPIDAVPVEVPVEAAAVETKPAEAEADWMLPLSEETGVSASPPGENVVNFDLEANPPSPGEGAPS